MGAHKRVGRKPPTGPIKTAAARATRWSVLFSKTFPNWTSPDDLVRELDKEFHFSIDACAENREVAKFPRFFSPEQDGLRQDWGRERVWCNPPYNETAKWLAKGHESAQRGATCVFLVPARTDTKTWHEDVIQASEVRFIRGRLRFGNATNSAPFPSAIIIFRPPIVNPVQLSLWDDANQPVDAEETSR